MHTGLEAIAISRLVGNGWQRAFIKGHALITKLGLSPLPDPELAMASRKQEKERNNLSFLLSLIYIRRVKLIYYEIVNQSAIDR